MIPRIQRAFEQYTLNLSITEHSGHAVLLAEEAVKVGAEIIISVGGDGTLNEVVNGIMKGCKATDVRSSNIKVGVLPVGSGNDFVKNFASQYDLDTLKKQIEGDCTQLIDIGVAEFQSSNNELIIRYFVNIADIGIGGVIAEKLSRYKRWLGGNVTYQRAILSTFLSYRPQPLSVSTDTQHLSTPMMSLVVANGKYFGSGLGIAPEADVSSGTLEVVMLQNITLLDYLRQLPKVRRCEKIHHPEISYARSKRVVVTSLNATPLPIDMDGEYVGMTPVTFLILPQSLSFITSRAL